MTSIRVLSVLLLALLYTSVRADTLSFIASLTPSQSKLSKDVQMLDNGVKAALAEDRILRRDYNGFSVWLNCSERGAIMFHLTMSADRHNEPRAKEFALDPNVPSACQQGSHYSYSRKLSPPNEHYDRFHLVPANAVDYSATAIRQSNYMTNVVPGLAVVNRKGGAWYKTEMIAECMRDHVPLTVIGGVIYGNDTGNDHFTRYHKIKTPDFFWKIILTEQGQINAWVIPNRLDSLESKLDSMLIPVTELERLTGHPIDAIPEQLKNIKPDRSFVQRSPCNFS